MSYPIPSAGPSTQITSISGLVSAHGLAGLVQLVYVRIGNEVMAQALGALETALSATQSSLGVLTDLQGLHNQIGVGAMSALPSAFYTALNGTYTYSTFPTTITNVITTPPYQVLTTTDVLQFPILTTLTNSTVTLTQNNTSATFITSIVVNSHDSYIKAYNILGSAFYGKPIDPYFAITAPGAATAIPITAITSAQFLATASPSAKAAFASFVKQLASDKAQISGLIATLSGITPKLPNGSADPTTLLAKLRVVYSELPSGSNNFSFASTRAWILDSYNVHGSSGVVQAGLLQQNITNAITAGESLNSSQNSSVRNYMFIFEQYYQSAASVMSILNQTMGDIARKLSG